MLAALAQVRFKRYMTTAAGRLVKRAMASERFSVAPPALKAEVHYLAGQVAARHARDFEGLVWPGQDFAVSTPDCIGLGIFCENFTHPVGFNEELEGAASLESLAADERAQMVEAYRAAVEDDSTNLRALGALLLSLADAGEWHEYERYARRGVASNREAVVNAFVVRAGPASGGEVRRGG